jgi:opacity protein-like surface antigen
MQKITSITAALLLVCAFSVIAQPSQGRLFLGASSSMNPYGFGGGTNFGSFYINKQIVKSDDKDLEDSNNDGDSKDRSFNFAPKIGYFLADNIVVGLGYSHVNFFSSYTDDNSSYESKDIVKIVCPFVRLYAPVSTVSLFLDVEGGLGILKDNQEYDYFLNDSFDEKDESSSKATSIIVSLGVAIPLADRINLDLAATYNRLGIEDKEDNPDNTRYINISYGAKIGFTFFLLK